MNPNPAAHSDPSPMLYGYPCAVWTIPIAAMGPLTARLYTEALAAIGDPASETARLWADELADQGYRAITHCLSLPQVVSLVSELPPRAIVRLTGRRPDDAARREAVRMLYTEPED